MPSIDRSVDEAYAAVVRLLPRIRSLRLRPYRKSPVYEERMGGTDRARALVAEARRLRDESGIPFWDAVLARAERAGEVDRSVLRAASFHQLQDLETVVLPREELLSSGFAKAFDGRFWAVLSETETTGSALLHLPMLDFRCSVSESSLDWVVAISDHLAAYPFVILETGRSYHFVGAALLDFSGLVSFLGRASLFGPLVDRAYVAHQLIEGCAALRISGDAHRAAPRACFATLPSEAWSA